MYIVALSAYFRFRPKATAATFGEFSVSAETQSLLSALLSFSAEREISTFGRLLGPMLYVVLTADVKAPR